MRRKLFVVLALGGLVAGLGFGGVSAMSNNDPPLPPWVNPDGTINEDELPGALPVLDCTGRVVGVMQDPFDPNNDTRWIPTRPAGADCPVVSLETVESTSAGVSESTVETPPEGFSQSNSGTAAEEAP